MSMPEELTMNINDLSMCESFSEYYEVLGAAVNVVRNDRTICCPSMRLTFRKYPKVSGTFSLGPKVVNNRQWWRNGGFAIWFDGRSNWVIGLVRNLLQKQYRNAFAVSGTKTNCPVDIRIWKIVKENRKVKTKMTCKCCNLLTVKGSLYIQNPKYGIYSIDGQRGGSLVYKQRWPTKPYNNNYIYYTGVNCLNFVNNYLYFVGGNGRLFVPGFIFSQSPIVYRVGHYSTFNFSTDDFFC